MGGQSMDSGTIEEIAARWILRQHEESWTTGDEERLEAWLEESVLHRVAFIRLDTVWQETPRLKVLGAGLPNGVVPPPSPFKAGSVSLEAGMMAKTAKSEILVSRATPAELEEALSWRTGFVTFHDTALIDAVTEFNRYRVRKIMIVDPTIASLRINGKFRSGNADAFLWLLQKGFPVTVEEEQGHTVLKRRPQDKAS
jgi:ferric-dicitrate binding protein FerR (iron transport regulator)